MQNVYETERLILTQSDVSIAGRVAEYFLRNKEFFRETEPTRDEEFFIEDYQREQMCNHNGASLAVAKKLGFQNEGISRSYLRINGIWEDHIHMVLLNTQMQDQ